MAISFQVMDMWKVWQSFVQDQVQELKLLFDIYGGDTQDKWCGGLFLSALRFLQLNSIAFAIFLSRFESPVIRTRLLGYLSLVENDNDVPCMKVLNHKCRLPKH